MKNVIAAMRIVGGKTYEIRLIVNGFAIELSFVKIDNFMVYAEQLRAQGVQVVDTMIQHINPFESVFYCTFEIDGRKIYQVSNEIGKMIEKLTNVFALRSQQVS